MERKQVFEGQDLYIRVAASELDHNRNDSHLSTRNNGHIGKKKLVVILVVCAAALMCTAILGLALCIRRKKQEEPVNKRLLKVLTFKNEKEDIDLPTFDLSTIANATNHFSGSNKLGEGGFGAVYKGILENGQEIAVKRLSKNSGQGPEEFKNEVVSIANLQHRNLVKLLGCCFQNDEKILIYEYMPNRSLDYFIFDRTKRNLMNWTHRFQIINGIARGLLYLHHDCRLRIIHRDLKVSNILLDHNMNSKISDFGLARTFGGDKAEAKTKRVMGTYGYMPPEYAVHGLFSVKTDVFSFGVIILEIVSGRKNREFCDPCDHLNLLGHAWRLWIEERALELTDESIRDSLTAFEVLRKGR
ncbi:hypothetical protein L6164_018522 [Bauhinia variegata]|uniref:Uncharacterized protein n=1 Tax=Bauhinia variegata TaxID=167791 RepID=A0ACB9NCI4_BAUVA|nr:hypothetical protein L6164_018522 [Bauhinia variegata]